MGETRSDQRENADPAQRQAARQPQRARQEPRASSAPGSAPRPRPSATRTSSPARLLLSASAVLVVVVLIGALALKAVSRLRPTPTSATSAPSILRLSPFADGMKCVTRIAWSPDGRSVAVLGDTRACGGSALGVQTSQILIYNAWNGEITQRLTPDSDVLASSTPEAEVFATPDVSTVLRAVWQDPRFEPRLRYTNLVWTPDSKALLLPFSVLTSDPRQPADATYLKGLLREGVLDSAPTSVWIDTIHASEPGEVERWDLDDIAPALVPAPVAAAAYRWSGDGTLSADTSAATGAVGAPAGGATFTVWQPGRLGYTVASSDGSISAKEIGWTASIASVSPDGRYFYESVSASGSLVPPSTAQTPQNEPTLAPHDQALQALAQQLTQAPTPDPATALLVAWRPDGRLLATVTQPSPSATASAATVSIYDTTTGQQVKQLTPDASGQSGSASTAETLEWSPDGAQLLLADNADGAITIWGPGSLPV